MTAVISPPLIFTGTGFGGLPLPFGKLFSYVAGTSTPQATWTDSTQGQQNANPIILNANAQAPLWLDPSLSYKFKLTDELGNQVYITDQVQGALTASSLSTLLTQSFIGGLLYPRTAAETAALVIPTNIYITTEPWYDIKRYGAQLSNTSVQNLAALNTAIKVAQASSDAAALNGVTILIPPDCHYGYNFLTPSTWPQINSGTVPITVIDFSQGDTYDAFPTRYDGTQQRTFFYTPQTTSPGQHNGNGALINGNWFPYYQTSVNVVNAVPSVNSYDNLRAGFLTAWQQRTGWSIAQGSLSGAGLTPAQMLNFFIQQGPAAQATVNFTSALGAAATSATLAAAASLYTDASGNWLGYSSPVLVQFSDGQIRTGLFTNGSPTFTFQALTGSGQTNVTFAGSQLTPLIIDYLTLNWIVGASSNDATQANYRFKASTDAFLTFMIESLSDPCYLVLRDQAGATNDVYIKNESGALALTIPSLGDALVVAKVDRKVQNFAGITEGQSLTAAVITNGATINTVSIGVTRVAPTANVTGIILATGSYSGQMQTVINEANFTVTFAVAGTSNVADGVTSPIPALCSRRFVWDSATSLWYRNA